MYYFIHVLNINYNLKNYMSYIIDYQFVINFFHILLKIIHKKVDFFPKAQYN